MKRFKNLFAKTVSLECLFDAWNIFKKGKRRRQDVQEFERYLEVNIFDLHKDLLSANYKHGTYSSFYIQDPKIRHIRKACVRDRLVHQAVYSILYEVYEPKFINDLYSSRVGKGTHKAVHKLQNATRKISKTTLSLAGRLSVMLENL